MCGGWSPRYSKCQDRLYRTEATKILGIFYIQESCHVKSANGSVMLSLQYILSYYYIHNFLEKLIDFPKKTGIIIVEETKKCIFYIERAMK